MNANIRRWVILGSREYDEDAVLELLDLLKPFMFSEEEEFGLRLSLNEAILNGINHGNEGDKNKNVILEFEDRSDRFVFTITDEGPGFDHRKMVNPTEPDNLTKEHGRGIFLMQNYMDSVSFSDQGRKVVLEKLKKPSTGSS